MPPFISKPTALGYAVMFSPVSEIKRLIAEGVDGNTALVYATHHSSTTALRMLLATAPAGEQISRALVRAAECGRVRAMTLLLAATNPLWPQQIPRADRGRAALHHALASVGRGGNLDTVRLLLAADASTVGALLGMAGNADTP